MKWLAGFGSVAFLVCVWGCGGGGGGGGGQMPNLPNSQSSLPRLPDDQVEGEIWEFTGTLMGKPKGDEPLEVSGKFRVEGNAIFDISPRLGLPPKREVEEVVEKVKKGGPIDIKLPPAPQQKRLGEFKLVRTGKTRVEFHDPDSWDGLMMVEPKRGSEGVMIGDFKIREGGKFVREYLVELRQIED